MCGIFAYTRSKEAGKLLLNGLSSLEYRGRGVSLYPGATVEGRT